MAKNTVFLYVRMLAMLVIGLFTYRIILRSLGVSDYGVYSAVGGVVTIFSIVLTTVNTAIGRYITVSLGRGDAERLKTVFGTSVLIMAFFSLLVILFMETGGLWYLHHKMVIPDGRMGPAETVLHTSLALMVVNLMSVPFMSVIIAHEHMKAYAYISVLEAVFKMGVAAAVFYSAADKLAVYAFCLLAVGLLVRTAYALYARRHFPETRGRIRYDGALVREMGAFAGWNFFGSGAYMLNTQGINQLMNLFFGVGVNAARGVADKVDQVVRQFATNIATALNPQLTKSYAKGDRDYAFDLVCKGSKYYFWILWIIAIPFFTDSESILTLWLGSAPPEAARFTRLALLCFLIDFTPNTIIVLEQANGRMKRFYLITSGIAVLVFPVTWLLYRLGAQAWTGYAVFAVCYVFKGIAMLMIAHHDTGFPPALYLKKAILPVLWAAVPAAVAVIPIVLLVPPVWWRFIAVTAAGLLASGAGIWLGGLTEGEKSFVRSHIIRNKQDKR
ncbi:MAG: lipopolysaccharide biosynthesis protein [Bacteroidales bacterium]|nr:lipopolysaccharide biosynthesis protein [Bacteroidales bacterium]